jgi:tungstate transport system ATP-binding protein
MQRRVLFSLNHITHTFATGPALRIDKLHLHAGERVALIGGNGSGKTTLLRLLHGLIEPTQGQIDRPISIRPELSSALVFQQVHALRSTVVANVSLGLRLKGVSKAEATAQALIALDRVGLADYASHYAPALSVGQCQRMGFAKALALKTPVLLLDEPTASLDPASKRGVEALMATLSEDISLVFSSHNLGQVKRLADRVLYLEHGELVCDMSTEAFFNSDLCQLPAAAATFLRAERI